MATTIKDRVSKEITTVQNNAIKISRSNQLGSSVLGQEKNIRLYWFIAPGSRSFRALRAAGRERSTHFFSLTANFIGDRESRPENKRRESPQLAQTIGASNKNDKKRKDVRGKQFVPVGKCVVSEDVR